VEAQRFDATLELNGPNATFIEVPLDVPAVFGRVRAPVRGTLNGFPFRSTIMRYGTRYYLPVNKALREGSGAAAGETVTVALEADDAPRVVEVPDDLREALASAADARTVFEGLSYTHQREYVEWIEEAKRAATRTRRVERTVEMLARGVQHP
jgi:hypothetical protein